MYRFDTSIRGIAFRARSTMTAGRRMRGGAGGRGRSPVRSARTGGARAAARHPDARLRAAQAPERPARGVPRVRVRLALPMPEGSSRPGTDRRGAAQRRRQAAGRPPLQDRLPADRGGQGAAAAAPGRARPGRVGGRRVRRPVRLLRPDPRGHPAAHPGGPPDQARGAAGRRPGGDGPDQGTTGQLHARAAPAWPGVGRAGGPLAERADRLGTPVGQRLRRQSAAVRRNDTSAGNSAS